MVQSLIGLRFFSYVTDKRVGLSWERLQHLQFVQCSAFNYSETPGTFKDRTRRATPEQQKLQTVEMGPRVIQRAEVIEGRGFSVFILFKKKIQEHMQTRWKWQIPPASWEQERICWRFYKYVANTLLCSVYVRKSIRVCMFRCMCLCVCILIHTLTCSYKDVILRSLMGLDFIS